MYTIENKMNSRKIDRKSKCGKDSKSALDGGKILILIIEAIRRKPLKEQTEINIQLLGFSILIVLSLYVTYNDIIRIS